MVDLHKVKKFYDSQKIIISIGGVLSILSLFLYTISFLFILLSTFFFCGALLICDRREKKFKKSINNAKE